MSFDPKHLSNAHKEDVQAVLEACSAERRINRFDSNGTSKSKVLKARQKFPVWMIFHPEFSKYFDRLQDKHESKKNQDRLCDILKERYGWDFRVTER